MGDFAPDKLELDNPDEFQEIVRRDLNKVIIRYFDEIPQSDLPGFPYDGLCLWEYMFLGWQTPVSLPDLKSLKKLRKHLTGAQEAFDDLSDDARIQLKLAAAEATNWNVRDAEIDTKGVSFSPHDAALALDSIHEQLQQPISTVESIIEREVPKGTRINATNWKNVSAMDGCWSFWGEVTGDSRKSWDESSDFASFVGDVFNYLRIEEDVRSCFEVFRRRRLKDSQ